MVTKQRTASNQPNKRKGTGVATHRRQFPGDRSATRGKVPWERSLEKQNPRGKATTPHKKFWRIFEGRIKTALGSGNGLKALIKSRKKKNEGEGA